VIEHDARPHRVPHPFAHDPVEDPHAAKVSSSELDAIAKTATGALADGALFWSAYPKGTSKKYKGADINRDTGHARMKKHGFDGVSLIAVDADWSAMRFKRV
jgi:hypothetical protein